MKELCFVAVLLSASLSVHAQGTFIYDQQSADENHYQDGGVTFGAEPGQSFTPSFDSIGFVRIYIYGGGGSGTFSVTLRSDSITGTILASTTPVSITVGGPVDFFFPSPVSITPGKAYYFQPTIQAVSGGFGIFVANYNYSGGTAFINGNPDARDLWFREGIIVPEPSSLALLLIGAGGLLWVRKRLLLLGTGILFWRRRVRHH
jgi:hypothetical protein